MKTTPDAAGDQDLLARRLQTQDREAFRNMVERFTPLVLRQARALLGSLPEAEDAAQDVFVKAFRALGQFRGGKVAAWLSTITHHTCLDRLRQRRAPAAPLVGEDLAAPAPEAGETPTIDLLADLPDIEREVLHLRLVEEIDYAEIAAITGYAEGSLRNVVSRGVRRLRERVAAPRPPRSAAGEE